jgi:GT2 family glycosyltransferase
LSALPLVAVVTLNWNGAAFLRECVDSVLASDYASFYVIVVDNGSTDNSCALLDDLYAGNPAVKVLKNKANLGYSRGMNVGLDYGFKNLGADHCLVMNNDTRLDRQAIAALVRVAEVQPQTGFVTGKVYYYDQPGTFQTVGKNSHPVLVNGGHIGKGEKDEGQYDKDRELAFCDDIFWLVSRKVYEATGGYDPEFFLQAEDFDWQLRAKNAGFKIMYAHKAKLWHKESMAIGKKSPQKAYYDARNPTIAVINNCDPEVVRKYIKTKVVQIQLPAIIKRACKGHLMIAFAMLRGLCSAMAWKQKHS